MVHVGGAVGGYIYIKILFGREVVWDILPGFKGRQKSSSYKVPSGWSYKEKGSSSSDSGGGRVTQKELDQLLDKISVSGINSLSESEMEILRRAREQMQNQGR